LAKEEEISRAGKGKTTTEREFKEGKEWRKNKNNKQQQQEMRRRRRRRKHTTGPQNGEVEQEKTR
jgi:hypothetical protein